MISSFLIGIGGMVFLIAIWVLVQNMWRSSFSDYISDDDVLADRRSCGNCGCTTICETKRSQLTTK